MTQPVVVAQVMGRLSPGGGVQVVVRRLAQSLDPNVAQMHVITTRPAWDDLSDVPVVLHPLGFGGKTLRRRDRLSIMWKVAQTVRRLSADVVQLHSGTAWMGLLARITSPRTPFILEVHDAPGSGRHGGRTDRFEAFCVRRLGVAAVCHSAQVSRALRELSKVPDSSIRQFPLGINTSEFRSVDNATRSEFRARHGLDHAAVVVVAVGRLAPSKRWDLAIDATVSARRKGVDLSLIIIGVGEDPELRRQIEESGASGAIHLWGALFGNDLAVAIASCDILCSTSEYEGFGLTIIEGMACGLPVLAMAAGGVTDLVVDSSTGFLVDVGDVGTFTERLIELHRSPTLRSRMGSAGHARAIERFDATQTAASFLALYRELSAP